MSNIQEDSKKYILEAIEELTRLETIEEDIKFQINQIQAFLSGHNSFYLNREDKSIELSKLDKYDLFTIMNGLDYVIKNENDFYKSEAKRIQDKIESGKD